MIRLRLFALLAVGLILATSSAAQTREPEAAPVEPNYGLMATTGDNDPRIYPEEVRAPELDSRDPAWEPAYEWHSGEAGEGRGADSLSCDGRDACEDYKTEETRAEPTHTEAPK